MEDRLSSFFDTIISLLQEAERQYGFASQQYTEYVLERLQLSINTCRSLKSHVEATLGEELRNYIQSLQKLLEYLMFIRRKWLEYQDILDSQTSEFAYQVPVQRRERGRGRPRFHVTKEQLEYLVSLSFTYSEIASLIGVSRATIYRYSKGIRNLRGRGQRLTPSSASSYHTNS